jgi:hypothetical protein
MPLRAVRSLLHRLFALDWPGEWLAALSGPAGRFTVQRQAALQQRFERRRARFFADLTVRGGPFVGLRYPAATAYGSSLYPKLLGSYEAELHPAFARLRTRSYDDIVDIGFAEGYYLVGLAQRFPGARVWGYDPSPAAHRLCTDLAAANALEPACLRLQPAATPEALAPALTARALVICDCEGYEAELFASGHSDRWRRADLVIETHDFLVPGIAADLATRLAPTHAVEIAPADSTPAARLTRAPAAARRCFSSAELVRLLDEGRPPNQVWLVATARAS